MTAYLLDTKFNARHKIRQQQNCRLQCALYHSYRKKLWYHMPDRQQGRQVSSQERTWQFGQNSRYRWMNGKKTWSLPSVSITGMLLAGGSLCTGASV